MVEAEGPSQLAGHQLRRSGCHLPRPLFGEFWMVAAQSSGWNKAN